MKTILGVDDQKHLLKLLEYAVERTGFAFEKAASAEEALAKALAQPIDLFLIDFEMPGKNGFELMRDLKKHPQYASVPIILLTGRGQSEIRLRAQAAGVSAFLTKPFSSTELAGHIRRLLAS